MIWNSGIAIRTCGAPAAGIGAGGGAAAGAGGVAGIPACAVAAIVPTPTASTTARGIRMRAFILSRARDELRDRVAEKLPAPNLLGGSQQPGAGEQVSGRLCGP